MFDQFQPVLEVTNAERDYILELAAELIRSEPAADSEGRVASAQLLAAQLPERFRRDVQRFCRFGSPCGGFLIRGLPTGDIPPTPDVADDPLDPAMLAPAVLALVAALFGDQYSFLPELGGRIPQSILPVRGFENTQQSISSLTLLKLHVETAFTGDRADFVCLFCLRQDHDGIAGTLLSPIEEILKLLDARTIEVLRQPWYKTSMDASFGRGMGISRTIFMGPISILSGPPRRPKVQCDFEEVRGINRAARRALNRLHAAVADAALTIRLRQGDLIVIDNHHAFHGRTSFEPHWDHNDRWLLRTFITRDLARSAADRPQDGRIIDRNYGAGPDVFPRIKGFIAPQVQQFLFGIRHFRHSRKGSESPPEL